MIEILAEFSCRNVGFEIASRRRHDAHVDIDLVGAADALEGLVDQHAQNLVLRLARHVGNFVDKERAVVRLLERSDLALLRPVRRFHPEQFRFHPLGRDGRGVDDDEWSIRALRVLVDRARRQFLAGAGRPNDHDAAVCRRDLLDHVAKLIDGRRAADEACRLGSELLELPHLALEARVLQRAVRDQHEAVGLERLLDEVVSAALDRGDGGFDVAVAGDHHDRQLGMLLLDIVEQLQPIELAALQPDIEKQEIGATRRDRVQRRVAIARGARLIAFILQDPRNQFADIRLVVDDENVRRHLLARRFENLRWL